MKKRTKKRMPLAAWIGFGLAAVLLAFNGYTFAKYVSQKEQEPVIAARNFYFESDLLTKDGKTYTLKAGVNQIRFSLMNYPDELRVAEVDIPYEIWVNGSKYANFTAKKGETEDTDGKLNIADKKLDITLPNLAAGTYTVEAKATDPYVKTLKATFTIVAENNGIVYTVSDSAGSPTLLLTVTTTDHSGNVTISWPDGVLPDNADPLMKGAGASPYIVQNFPKNAEYTFVFFKKNPAQTYTRGNFSVS